METKKWHEKLIFGTLNKGSVLGQVDKQDAWRNQKNVNWVENLLIVFIQNYKKFISTLFYSNIFLFPLKVF